MNWRERERLCRRVVERFEDRYPDPGDRGDRGEWLRICSLLRDGKFDVVLPLAYKHHCTERRMYLAAAAAIDDVFAEVAA